MTDTRPEVTLEDQIVYQRHIVAECADEPAEVAILASLHELQRIRSAERPEESDRIKYLRVETECGNLMDFKELIYHIDALATYADRLQVELQRIRSAERPEPVAWTTKLALDYKNSELTFRVCGGNLWGTKGVPLYGPELLDAYDRMAAGRDAALKQLTWAVDNPNDSAYWLHSAAALLDKINKEEN